MAFQVVAERPIFEMLLNKNYFSHSLQTKVDMNGLERNPEIKNIMRVEKFEKRLVNFTHFLSNVSFVTDEILTLSWNTRTIVWKLYNFLTMNIIIMFWKIILLKKT